MIPKFRAWLKNDKEMIDVDEIHFDNGQLDFIGDAITFMRKANEIELLQSTGLLDKNGKEIFEKDIVDYRGRKAIVNWHGSYASFIYRFVDELHKRNAEWNPLYLAYLKFEVIGNVYENKDLLEASDDQ